MRLIDADALIRFIDMGHLRSPYEKSFSDSEVVDMLETAPTVDAVKATMPWTNPDGTETMLDEVSYEIGYSQGQLSVASGRCER